MEGDINSENSIAKPWSLCSVKQVEDLKQILTIFPLWSSSIFLATPLAIQATLTILQALSMDRRLGHHFTIPAGSLVVILFISSSLFLPIYDKILIPTGKKLTGRSPSPLQRIGAGHVLTVLGLAVSAAVESKRLKHKEDGNSIVSMSALWLFPQLILVGIGEAFHVPGQMALYYQEFPVTLRSTATAMLALIISIAFYMGTAVIDFIRRITRWLPDNLDDGRLDCVYGARGGGGRRYQLWVLCGLCEDI